MEPDLAVIEDVVADEHHALLGAVDAGLLGRVAGGVVALKGVVAHLQRQLVGEGDVGLADLLLALGQQQVDLGGVLTLQQIQIVLIGGLVERGGDLIVTIEHFFVGDDGGTLLLQVGVAENMVDMRLGVDQILDAAALFLGESDHLLQLGEPLGGIDKHGALAGHDHAGVAAAHTGEGIDVRGDLLDFNIGGADGVIVICPMALANSNNF